MATVPESLYGKPSTASTGNQGNPKAVKNCWFCRNTIHSVAIPDGKPICGKCDSLLLDFLMWLRVPEDRR